MVAVFITVILNTGWKQTVDLFTGNKYGASTQLLFLVLSFCAPLLYLNNIFWSINFARNQMRTILRCIVVTFLVNICADLVLIPLFSSLGAAIGFLISVMVQTAFYARYTRVRAALLLFPLLPLAGHWTGKRFIAILPVRQPRSTPGYRAGIVCIVAVDHRAMAD
jgi:peptidoglycan biosynthesis protein MviN/MurJ (putative lipid II flippase)